MEFIYVNKIIEKWGRTTTSNVGLIEYSVPNKTTNRN